MDDRSAAPVLSAVECEAAESLLGDAWGEFFSTPGMLRLYSGVITR